MRKFLHLVGQRQDLVVVVLLVSAILMMIVPLPTWLVDTLIAVNLAASVLLLMMALFIKDPLELSTLPSIILIVTIFRLALSVTTTRLILVQADAGEIIRTFGEFVIAGNLAVGMVVFLIITIVQFIVITKGSERVAEVSARFTLDAMPGKQMAIDADLRNGDIDAPEARRRRNALTSESQFHGAMDGAMKFVKGDAIAGLVIVAINLLGGMAVGVMQHGMSASQAGTVYSLLTIGDGLATQLPALFVSLGASALVTRVSADGGRNLSADITRQMFSSKIALRMAGVVLAVVGLIPGFPTLIFLLLGLGFGALSFSDEIRRRIFGEPEVEAVGPNAEAVAAAALLEAKASPFALRVDPNLLDEAEEESFRDSTRQATHELNAKMGLTILPPRLIRDSSLPEGSARIELDEVSVAEFHLRPGALITDAEEENLRLAGVPFESAPETPPGFARMGFAPEAAREKLIGDGLTALTPAEALARVASAAQKRYASACVGVQEARLAVSDAASLYPDLASEARSALSANKFAEVLRRLVDEGVPLRNWRVVLEAIAEWGAKEQDPVVLSEYVRTALKRQICDTVAGPDRVIPAYLLDRSLEDVVRGSIRQTTVGEYLALDDMMSARMVEAIRGALREPMPGAPQPVILTSLDVRRFTRTLLANNGLRHVPVLSFQDLADDFTVAPLATIGPGGAMNQAQAAE
ncbi:type III secretion system export apparatus subunit SctV [Neomegalonema sp.]|uniref:type III secretion system export apparatus subunit SctV n=1 Tax=Neomegalonema sp. TaxID=2039713 RepID=UPI002630A768|nr:type III secretion system export apparatus subunit SctV [Neomegalonema sp.]MDD2868160.1 type III secretion system export apparatus subunit SctV [Neomegalonema sp.]